MPSTKDQWLEFGQQIVPTAWGTTLSFKEEDVRLRAIHLVAAVSIIGLVPADAAPAAQAAPAKSKHKLKPSLKISGISVNMQNFPPGTKVTTKEPVNACYGIGGAAFTPMSLTAVGFVHAVKIPSGATTTVVFTTPWASAANGSMDQTGQFSKLLHRNKGHGVAAAFGGAEGPYDYYTYLMLPTGYPTSSYIDGTYTFKVTTKAGGKTLHASGTVTVAC